MYGMQRQILCGGSARGPSDYAQALVSWAKMELLKEKVKARMNEKYGKQLDALADLVAEVVAECTRDDLRVDEQEQKLSDAWDALDPD